VPFPVRRRDDGQKGFFRDEEVKRKRRELRAENGYVSKAHQGGRRCTKKTLPDRWNEKATKICDALFGVGCLQIILLFRPAKLTALDLCPKKVTSQLNTRSSPAAQLQTLSSSKFFFFFFFAHMSVLSGAQGVSVKNKLATVRIALSCAERFFGGCEEATGSKIVKDDRTDIY